MVLMILSLFFPAFVIDQEMESKENPERYTHQTNGFTPWGYNADIETTVHNETGSLNDTDLQISSSFSTYTQSWISVIPLAASTLVLGGLLGSVLLFGLLIAHRPTNQKRGVYTYLLFWPVVFSCILLAAMFFFLIPRVVDQEMNLPEAYSPDMPAPSIGSEDGDLMAIGYGSDLYDRRPVGDEDTFSYTIQWSPGISTYLYIASFIFTFFGFVFYSKMRKIEAYKKAGVEEDAEEEDEEIIVLAGGIEEEDVEEAEVEEEEDTIVEETPADEEALEEQDTESALEKIERTPALKSSSPDKEKDIPLGEPEITEDILEPELEEEPPEPVVKRSSKVSIIEMGAQDFTGDEDDDEPLTIEGEDEEANVECPGCGMAFKTTLGGTIKCPFCGLKGDAG